jgi:hypothetical protein
MIALIGSNKIYQEKEKGGLGKQAIELQQPYPMPNAHRIGGTMITVQSHLENFKT